MDQDSFPQSPFGSLRVDWSAESLQRILEDFQQRHSLTDQQMLVIVDSYQGTLLAKVLKEIGEPPSRSNSA